ncbi:MAG: hypothetical protein WC976_06700 [Caldisericia bacterium]
MDNEKSKKVVRKVVVKGKTYTITSIFNDDKKAQDEFWKIYIKSVYDNALEKFKKDNQKIEKK